MNKLGQTVEDNATLLVRRAALATDAAVVLATPVDTGRARSNWQASLNAPATGTREAYVEGSSGSSAGANAQAAIDQGKTVIGATKNGDAVHLTNNLPYIGRLNEGHSAQAPAGFVEEAIQVGLQAVRDFGGILVERSK